MVDYGNAPFLWLADRPEEAGVGGLLCDGTSWDKSLPMSEGLWQKFSNWAIEFDRTSFYSENFNTDSWDWIAFHARGMQLSRWLKDEVGPAYRVVYVKPCEDPNHRIDERTEILAGGGRLVLNPFLGSTPNLFVFANASSQAVRPGRIVEHWTLPSSTATPMVGGHPMGAKLRTARYP